MAGMTKRHTLPRQVVLVLQGGGALGAYQAGVFEALSNAGIEPDWVIGTSIGAINGALIAGNVASQRVPKLREFWQRLGNASAGGNWATLLLGVPTFFRPRPTERIFSRTSTSAVAASANDGKPEPAMRCK